MIAKESINTIETKYFVAHVTCALKGFDVDHFYFCILLDVF